MLLPATPGWVSLPVFVGGPRHSWLGSAGGVGVWCVVCGGGVLLGLWLVCGVVSPSPLLAEVPVCYSPPLLAGFRCRWWWAVPATPGWGPLAALVCGVRCVAVVCWWGCGWFVVWLVPRHSWRRFLCATPRHSWLGFAAGVCGRSPPLLAGVRWRRWCVVCGVWRWCVAGVVAGVWCGWSLATPGGGSCVLLPATPGWVSLPVVVGGPRHSWLGSAGGGGVWCVVAWPGRAGRPPGRVLVRLTFSFGRFVFLLCLAPSGLGLPPSLSLLLPFLVAVALCFGCFLFFFGLRLPGSPCARASFVSPAWLLAALWWLLPRSPPLLCLAVFVAPAWCLGVFFFLLLLPLCAPVVSGFLWFPAPGALGLGACVVCFVGLPLLGSPCACPSFVLSAWLLARCCVPCCAVRPWVRCCAALLRVLSPGVVLSCAVLRLFVPLLVALCSAALCFAVFSRAVCVLSWRGGACGVCLGVPCCAFPVLPALCGAVLRCAGALALCCSCGACCCWRLVLWCAAVCCAVSCGVPWCGAGSGGPWLSARGVFRCRCPCLAAWSASLWLVWFAVVPCFPVSCSVVLCCCALLSCCGAVGACFALLWAVVLCCVVLLVGCAVFCPVVVSACCGALFLVLCVPCLLRSVRCGALLCWLWCLASLCRVLWRCAVLWCCAVVLCCPFAVLFVFALPSCGLSCGASVVCAVVGASCCGVSLCVVVSPWAFCGVVVLLWCVVVSCCAVRCPVVS